MTTPFVHLHLHSEFSLADGIVRIKDLAKLCSDFSQPAVALTDLSNLYAVVKFYQACLSQGIKPIVGSDIWIENPFDSEQHDRITLICKDNAGYRNLSKLMTDAYLRGSIKNKIVFSWNELSMINSGLICLLDDQEGPLANALNQAQESQITEILGMYQGMFGDRLYLSSPPRA